MEFLCGSFEQSANKMWKTGKLSFPLCLTFGTERGIVNFIVQYLWEPCFFEGGKNYDRHGTAAEKDPAHDRGQHLEEYPALLGAAHPWQPAPAALQHRRLHHRRQLSGQQCAGRSRLQRLAHLPAHRLQSGRGRGCRRRGEPVPRREGQKGDPHRRPHLAGHRGHPRPHPHGGRHRGQPNPADLDEHPRRGAGRCRHLHEALFRRRAVQRHL